MSDTLSEFVDASKGCERAVPLEGALGGAPPVAALDEVLVTDIEELDTGMDEYLPSGKLDMDVFLSSERSGTGGRTLISD